MPSRTETAILAGGCAWIMQQLLRHPEGVISTRAGFTGGYIENPTEEDSGGHAEAVEVVFDPERLTYRGLLEIYFMVHRADLDEDTVGSIYRSEIFCTSPEQQQIAEEMIRDVDAAEHWLGPIVTKVSPSSTFWELGPEDQNFLQRYPEGCHQPFPHTTRVTVSSPAVG